MSSGLGYPDWQQIQQWLGAPVASQSAYPIGAAAKVEGPFNLASWASVIVAVKPTGGAVTLTVAQAIGGGPPGLVLSEQFVIPAGQTAFEAVVLYGDAVTVTLQGSVVGETVDYAIYPSNTTTNAQVLATATVNVQKAGALVAAEPTLDFIDGIGIKTTITDDPTNTRLLITIAQAAIAQAVLAVSAASVDVQNIPATYADLILSWLARGTLGTMPALVALLNNDSAPHYDYEQVHGLGTGATVQAFSGVGQANAFLGYVPGSAETAGIAGAGRAELPGYATTTLKKALTSLASAVDPSGTANNRAELIAVSWEDASAVNRLTALLTAGSLAAGTRITLEGRPTT